MRYTKASDVLPAELIETIQNYADGQYLYIPRKAQARRSWGEGTRTRQEIRERNRAIYAGYAAGESCRELAERFYLAEKTVSAIVRRMRSEEQ